MSHTDHFALLVAINHYPGLQDLSGPENDANAFRDWLVDAAGGDVPVNQVKLIRSSDFDLQADVYDARPTEQELKRALDAWLRDGMQWRDRVGTRLYLFFAGHGFTAGSSISDPALFTASAQNGDPAHIAGCRYAAKIVNAGFFDEVVLVMDCCQDVLKASQVTEPTWSPPDRNRSSTVKFLQAYGAPRGRKAFEDDLDGTGTSRGLFSSVLIEALRSAKTDDENWVTGQTLKSQVLNIWKKRFQARTKYDPPIRLPDGEDIRLYQRTANAAPTTVRVDVTPLVAASAPSLLELTAPAAAIEGGKTRGGKPARESISKPPREYSLTSLANENLEVIPGVYSVAGDSRDVVEIVPRIARDESAWFSQPMIEGIPLAIEGVDAGGLATTVSLEPVDPGLDIVVVDANLVKVASGQGRLQVALPPGVYKAFVSAPGAASETWLRVDEQPRTYTLDPVQFSSSAPLDGLRTTHEYQQGEAIVASVDTERLELSKPEAEGELFVFVRDSSHAFGAPFDSPFPWQTLRLVRLEDAREIAFDLASGTHGECGCAGLRVDVPAGTYVLVDQESCGAARYETELVVQVVAGWRTDVYLDCQDRRERPVARTDDEACSLRELDFSSAAMFVVPRSSITPLQQPEGRATELARLSLTSGRPAAVPSKSLSQQSPLAAIFAAYANATAASLAKPLRIARVRQCLELLPDDLRRSHPDAVLLDAWLRSQDKKRSSRSKPVASATSGAVAQASGPSVLVPSVAAGWLLLEQLEPRPIHQRMAVATLGQWRLAGSVWTQTRIPASKSQALRSQLQEAMAEGGGVVGDVDGAPTLDPTWSDEAWAPALPGLRRPNPEHSPFQQALRRRVLDGIAEGGGKASSVFELGAAFGLDRGLAAAAYREVFEGGN